MEEKTKEKQIIRGEVDYDPDRFGAEVYRITKAAENCLDYQRQQKYKAQQEKGNKSGYFYGEV